MFNRSRKILQRNSDIPYLPYLKDEIASRLGDRLLDIKRTFPSIAEIGVGQMCHHLQDTMGVKQVTVVDGSSNLLNNYTSPMITNKILQDEEVLPFKENSFDAILSNCNMHWINDLPGTHKLIITGSLIQIKNSLKPDGVFLGCLLGGDTLFELRTSLQLADIERRGGISPHISPMTNIRDIAGLLSRAGFTLTTVDQDEIQISFPSMWELLDDLRGMRETGCLMYVFDFL
jgi:NADH dehydrogenase [ubiquinone] 1 alpha subcomplex assembly factor 5